MVHGNRVYEVIKPEFKDWDSTSENKQNVSEWIKKCSDSERDVNNKNKIACEMFHNGHRGI